MNVTSRRCRVTACVTVCRVVLHGMTRHRTTCCVVLHGDYFISLDELSFHFFPLYIRNFLFTMFKTCFKCVYKPIYIFKYYNMTKFICLMKNTLGSFKGYEVVAMCCDWSLKGALDFSKSFEAIRILQSNQMYDPWPVYSS